MNERMQIRDDIAILNVDIQPDFCPGGKLGVSEGDLVVPVMNEINELGRTADSLVVFTKDWHPEVTTHFAKYGGAWPEHCVQGTSGAELHPDLVVKVEDVIVAKGMGAAEDAYSGFEARTEKGEMLQEVLETRGVKRLIVGGLATDYCIRWSVLDALKNGFEVYVIDEGVRAVNIKPDDGKQAWEEMVKAGAKRISLEEAKQLLTRGINQGSAR